MSLADIFLQYLDLPGRREAMTTKGKLSYGVNSAGQPSASYQFDPGTQLNYSSGTTGFKTNLAGMNVNVDSTGSRDFSYQAKPNQIVGYNNGTVYITNEKGDGLYYIPADEYLEYVNKGLNLGYNPVDKTASLSYTQKF